MPSLRTILVVWLLNSSIWTTTTSYLVPRQFRLTIPRISRKSATLQATQKDDILQAYQRLGEKLLKGRGETTPMPDVPPPPTASTESSSFEFDASTLTIPTPSIDEVSEKATQAVANIVSETIQKAQDTYRGAAQALTDSPRQPGMVPNFMEFVRNTFAGVRIPGDDSEALSSVKEKLSILQQNTLKFLDIPTDGSNLFTPKGAAIVDFIHSEKFAWYLVVLFFVLAVTQRRSGIEATRDDMNALVFSAERKAKDAAEAANQAAQGAAQALKMTETAIAQKAALQAEKVALETEIAKLTSEIKDLRVQLHEKHVKASKAAADAAAMEALEGEKTVLQAELAKKDAEIAKLRAQVKEKETKASKTAATEAAIESLEQEKVVLQGTLETMKGEIESLRSKLKSEQINASKAVSDSDTIKLLQEEKAALQAEVGRLAQQTKELRSKLEQQLAAAIPPPTPLSRDKVENQFFVTSVETPAPTPVLIADEEGEEAPAPAPAVSPEAEDEVVAPKKVAKKKTGAAKTAAPAKTTAAAKTAKKKEVVEVAEDWKSLSMTSLKRKSVKDLTDYLESKGVSTIDAEGKPLKKSDLVDAVLSL